MTTAPYKLALLGYSGFLDTISATLLRLGIHLSCLATHVGDEKIDGVLAALSERNLHRPMAEIADRAGIPLIRIGDPNSTASITSIKATGANAVLCCSAPILRHAFLDAFDGQVFNFHGSRKYRGRAGWSWLILNGETDDAVVLHWVNAGIDTGDWIASSHFSIPPKSYPIDVAGQQLGAFADLSSTLARQLLAGGLSRNPPAPARPYLPTLRTDLDGHLSWRDIAEDIVRSVYAFGWPYAGAKATLQAADRVSLSTLRIARAEKADLPPMHAKTWGCVINRTPGGPVEVACREGAVRLLTVRDEERELPASAHVRLGMRFVEMS